jgi:uncharacterized protein YoxC
MGISLVAFYLLAASILLMGIFLVIYLLQVFETLPEVRPATCVIPDQ